MKTVAIVKEVNETELVATWTPSDIEVKVGDWIGVECKEQLNSEFDVVHHNVKQPAQEPVLPNQRWSKENEMIESWKQPAQEPVYIVGKGWNCDEMPAEGTELYTHPAPSWQGLKMTEVWEIVSKLESDDDDSYSEGLHIEDFYRAIEQALKEKNHG